MNERSIEQKRAFSINFKILYLIIVSILACNAMWYKSEYVYQFCSKYLKHISIDYLHLVKEEADMLISVLGIEDVDQSSFLIKYIIIFNNLVLKILMIYTKCY